MTAASIIMPQGLASLKRPRSSSPLVDPTPPGSPGLTGRTTTLPINHSQTLIALGQLLDSLRSALPQELELPHNFDTKVMSVLTAAQRDTESALKAPNRRVKALEEKVGQLELELAGYEDMARSLQEVATVACKLDKQSSAPEEPPVEDIFASVPDVAYNHSAVPQPAAPSITTKAPASNPWFSDPALELPFALPSVACCDGASGADSSLSIGELITRDLQRNSCARPSQSG